MAREIERKFLVNGDEWRSHARGIDYRQGYLSTEKARTVRIRTVEDKGFLTIKGETRGVTRTEFEYEIPLADSTTLLEELCKRPLVEKTRYRIPFDGLIWEIDEFHGVNEGLVIAEVELKSEDQPFTAPPWTGHEVSHDPRYYNANLIAHPYNSWER